MSDSTGAAEIRVESVWKTYGVFEALKDISLTIIPGEFLTFLGPSGSGKTTMLMVLGGFEQASRGSVFCDGIDVTHKPAETRGFGMMFQGYALFPHMTVAENIAFPLKVQRRSSSEVKRRTNDMIEMVGLVGHAHKRPSALSGGQQQRVALARALSNEPPVLLLDEPFSALDRNLRGQMQDEMRRIHRETGTTFVFVTHDQSEALALSSRIAIFKAGTLQQVASPREIYERPANRFAAEFLGDINLLPLTDISSNGGETTARFEGATIQATRAAGTPTALLALRPEHMKITSAPVTDGNSISARIEEVTYLGADIKLALVTGGGTSLTLNTSALDASPAMQSGSNIWLSWPKDRGVFV
ncbi:MAG: ABC transporter ATP-binding protein [Roseobacter sp.]|nr:ABC transporter ATP-binding protein [Roseobacter sp.]